MPAVSVIIPVFNAAPWVARCARSVLGQTLEDMEFIFVDDASTDDSLAVLSATLEEFPARKSQVRVCRMPVNSGQAKVRMRALSMATGDYLYHCDGDDEILPDTCRSLYEKAVAENLDIVTCNILKEESPGRWREICGACSGVEALLRDTAPPNLVCRLIRRGLLDGVEAPPGNMGEDLLLTLQATLRAGRTGHINQAFYRYYYHGNATSKAAGKEAVLARWQGLQANMRVALAVLSASGNYLGSEPSIVHFKYNSRHVLEPLVHRKEGYRLWRETFPEVDHVLLRTPGISLEKKAWYVLIRLHLFGPVKRLTRLFR